MAQRPSPHQQEPARETAVALNYEAGSQGAPRVVAKGRGLVAQKIKEIAQANHIPIHQDDDLVELLAQIEIDREIPAELYGAVAEILSWIYRANTAMKRELSS